MDAASQPPPVGFVEKLGYGLGDTAINLFWQFCNIFLFYYYTDVYGLNPAAVGTLYLVATLWDAFNDPMMGAIADRTQTRSGKYRPYLLWCAVPYGVSGYLLFANPELSPYGKLVFAYATFLVFKTTYTAISVPYGAMMGVITDDAQTRVGLSTARFLGAFGGGLVISMLVRPLVKLFGGDSEVLGFQLTMAVFGVLSVAMLLTTYFTTRERLAPQVEKVNLFTDVGFLFRNRPWMVMGGAAVCTLAVVAVQGAVNIHYFKYYVGRAEEVWFTVGAPGTAFHLEFDLVTVFLSTGMVAFLLGVALTGVVSRTLGKRNGLIVLTLANAVTILAFFFIPPQAIGAMFAVNLLGKLCAGPTPALVWALYTDVADYGEWKFGRRATALVMSAAMFAQKLGLTLGGAMAGWLLDLFGFVANQPQTDRAILGIRIMFAIIPGGLALLNGIILLFYPLSQAQTETMQAELERKRLDARPAIT